MIVFKNEDNKTVMIMRGNQVYFAKRDIVVDVYSELLRKHFDENWSEKLAVGDIALSNEWIHDQMKQIQYYITYRNPDVTFEDRFRSVLNGVEKTW